MRTLLSSVLLVLLCSAASAYIYNGSNAIALQFDSCYVNVTIQVNSDNVAVYQNAVPSACHSMFAVSQNSFFQNETVNPNFWYKLGTESLTSPFLTFNTSMIVAFEGYSCMPLQQSKTSDQFVLCSLLIGGKTVYYEVFISKSGSFNAQAGPTYGSISTFDAYANATYYLVQDCNNNPFDNWNLITNLDSSVTIDISSFPASIASSLSTLQLKYALMWSDSKGQTSTMYADGITPFSSNNANGQCYHLPFSYRDLIAATNQNCTGFCSASFILTDGSTILTIKTAGLATRDDGGSSSNIGKILGIVLGSIGFALLVILIIVAIIYRKELAAKCGGQTEGSALRSADVPTARV